MYCSRCGGETDNHAKFCPACGLDFSTVTGVPRDDAPEPSEFEAVRDALHAEWDLECELGRGGMAIVYRARDRHLEREVAIKVLPFSLAFDKQFVERFQREARTAGRLEHPHIIPIYRVGKSGRVIFFVMKYLRGGSLSGLIEQRRKLSVDEIRRMLVETAGALHYAHEHDIVHRDIKPDNIMFDELGHAVLTDFGIAKAATGTRLTGTGMSIGTPHYMSPEQARAQSLDGRSDLYSLGVVAYQCLTGTVPFDGEDAFSIGYKHIMDELPTPALGTAAERELYAVIRRMMSKAPEDRFQSAAELAAVLQGGLGSGEQTLRTSVAEMPTTVIPSDEILVEGLPTGGPPTTPTTPIPEARLTPRGREAKRGGGVLVGVFVVLFLGLGGAGGYWYFMMDAVWPLPFLEAWMPSGGEAGPLVPPEDSSGIVSDSLSLVTADSMQAGDSTTAPPDSVVPPPASALPPTGTLVLTSVPRLARWSLDGEVQTDTILELEPGTYKIRVSRTNYETFDTSVPVGRGETVRVPVPALVRRRPVEPAPAPPKVDYCTAPGPDYNKDGSCYSRAPRANEAPFIPLPEGVQGSPRAVLWVKVLADGSVGQMDWHTRSGNPVFDLAAFRYARRRMSYTPATRGGQPVASWFRLPIQGRSP